MQNCSALCEAATDSSKESVGDKTHTAQDRLMQPRLPDSRSSLSDSSGAGRRGKKEGHNAGMGQQLPVGFLAYFSVWSQCGDACVVYVQHIYRQQVNANLKLCSLVFLLAQQSSHMT